ncbi:MAG: cell division protein FtsA [Verrucomicrobiales bacterium]|nr:cell division protein FtsA [Verrucomicrobiales bacterium]
MIFKQDNIIVGLEVGTSKVCAVVGEAGPDSVANIVGVGKVPSHGVRKGEIVDSAKAEEDIRAAVAEAEKSADIEIQSVLLGVTGNHIRGFNNRAVHNITSEEGEIGEDDVEDVMRQARNISLPAENEIIHAVRQRFHVDRQEGIVSPVGMLGSRLEVDVHVVHGQRNRLQNPIRRVRELQLQVEAVVFNGRASAMSVLTREQGEQGALLIDLGGGTTEFVAVTGGNHRHSGVLPVGGDHVTNDISVGLKISNSRAEEVKLSHGRATPDSSVNGGTLTFNSELGLSDHSVKLEHLHTVMHARLEEIFQLIRTDLEPAGILRELHGGVYLTGGGSRVSGITELASEVFGMPAAMARNQLDSGLQEVLGQPEYSSAIGLVKYGAQNLDNVRGRGPWRRFKNGLQRLVGRR